MQLLIAIAPLLLCWCLLLLERSSSTRCPWITSPHRLKDVLRMETGAWLRVRHCSVLHGGSSNRCLKLLNHSFVRRHHRFASPRQRGEPSVAGQSNDAGFCVGPGGFACCSQPRLNPVLIPSAAYPSTEKTGPAPPATTHIARSPCSVLCCCSQPSATWQTCLGSMPRPHV